MNKLPNVENATVDIRKIIEYALNPDNVSGGANKARVFESALGYNRYRGVIHEISRIG